VGQEYCTSNKETDVIDIRRFPEEERESLQRQAEKYQAENAKQSKKDKGTADQADSDTAAEN
jgi:hypothetical protein